MCFCFQAEDGIRDLVRSRGLGDVYKRQDYQSAQETFELIVSCAKQLEKGSLSYKAKLPVPDLSLIHI